MFYTDSTDCVRFSLETDNETQKSSFAFNQNQNILSLISMLFLYIWTLQSKEIESIFGLANFFAYQSRILI